MPVHVVEDLIWVRLPMTLYSIACAYTSTRGSLSTRMSSPFDYFWRVQTNILDHFNFLFSVRIPAKHIEVGALPLQPFQQSLVFVLNALHFLAASPIVQRFVSFLLFWRPKTLVHTLVHAFGRVTSLSTFDIIFAPPISLQTLSAS